MHFLGRPCWSRRAFAASEEQQLTRDGSSRNQVETQLRGQLPLEAKRRAATTIIDNSGDEAATRRQVEALACLR